MGVQGVVGNQSQGLDVSAVSRGGGKSLAAGSAAVSDGADTVQANYGLQYRQTLVITTQ